MRQCPPCWRAVSKSIQCLWEVMMKLGEQLQAVRDWGMALVGMAVATALIIWAAVMFKTWEDFRDVAEELHKAEAIHRSTARRILEGLDHADVRRSVPRGKGRQGPPQRVSPAASKAVRWAEGGAGGWRLVGRRVAEEGGPSLPHSDPDRLGSEGDCVITMGEDKFSPLCYIYEDGKAEGTTCVLGEVSYEAVRCGGRNGPAMGRTRLQGFHGHDTPEGAGRGLRSIGSSQRVPRAVYRDHREAQAVLL